MKRRRVEFADVYELTSVRPSTCSPDIIKEVMLYYFSEILIQLGLTAKEPPMPDFEETRLHVALVDCHGLSLDASYALTHAACSVANDYDAFRKLVEADATASEQYTAARMALKAYRVAKKLI